MAEDEAHDPPSVSPEAENLYAEYLHGVERGEPEDLEALCRLHPEHAGELRLLGQQYRRFRAKAGHFGLGPDLGRARDEERELAQLRALLRERTPQVWPYVVRGTLGQGSFGIVYDVLEPALTRRLALKVLRAAPGTPAETLRRLQRFLAEARVLARLDHPGIVPLHSIGLDPEGQACFAMQLVEGRDFGEIIRLARAGEEGWTRFRALEELLTVCDALAFAHARGIVHRDIKPANVRVAKVGETYVMDWGLARVAREDSAADAGGPEPSPSPPEATSEGAVIGTLEYMPPEQARGRREEVGPLADVYAVGALLYHLLTGVRPYAEFDEVTPARVLLEPPRSVRELAPDAHRELLAICEKAMQRDASRRYLSMAALAADLRAHLENRPVEADRRPWAAVTKWVGRNRALAASLATVLVMSVLAFAQMREARAGASLRRQGELLQRRALFLALVEVLCSEQPIEPFGPERAWSRAEYVAKGDDNLAIPLDESLWGESAYTRYVEDLLEAFAGFGVALDGSLPTREILARLRASLEDPQLPLALESLYALAEGLINASRVQTWQRERSSSWSVSLLDSDPLWQRLCELIDRFETSSWRRSAWSRYLGQEEEGVALASLAASDGLTGAQLAWLGRIVMWKDGPEAAGPILRRAIQLAPAQFVAHFQLGLIGGTERGLDLKLHHHGVATALRPSSSFAWYYLGSDYQSLAAQEPEGERQSFESEARRCYQRALELNPLFERVYPRLALLLSRREGIELIEGYLAEHAPIEDSLFTNLAFLYLEDHEPAGAISAARRGIELNPAVATHHFHLGRGLTDAGQILAAVQAYDEAACLDPTLWQAFTNAAGARTKIAFDLSPGEPGPEALELIDQALAAAREAQRLKPGEITSLVNIAVAHSWREELELAVEYFERAQQGGFDARPYLVGVRDELLRRGTNTDLVERIDGILEGLEPP